MDPPRATPSVVVVGEIPVEADRCGSRLGAQSRPEQDCCYRSLWFGSDAIAVARTRAASPDPVPVWTYGLAPRDGLLRLSQSHAIEPTYFMEDIRRLVSLVN